MKNTHDPFDDELRNRLDNYSEEPDDKLWSGIASNIDTVKPPFNWTKWLSVGSAIVVITSAVLYFSLNETTEEEIASAAKTSLSQETENESDKISAAKAESETLTSAENNLTNGAQSATVQEAGKQLSDTSDQQPAAASPRSNEKKETDVQNTSRNKTERTSQSLKREAKSNDGLNSATPRASSLTTSSSNAGARSNQSENGEQTSEPVDSHRGEVGLVNSDAKSISTKGTSTKSEEAPLTKSSSPTQQEKNSDGVVIVAESNANADGRSSTAPSSVNEDTTVIDSLNDKTETTVATTIAKPVDQEKEEKKKTNRKLSLYLTAMPTFGYQRIEANQNDNVFIESISKVSNFSTKRLGVRAEIGAEYALTPKFRVFGGVLYYQRKQTIDYIERVPVNEVIDNPVDSIVVIQPDFTSQARTFEYELRNLGVQIGLNYVLKEKKFLHTVGTGIEFHKALNSLPEGHDDLGFHSNPSTFVFANVYYRLQYPAQGKLRAVFQPTFNYSLYLNQDMNAPFFVKPYGLGLNVGLTYHF